MCGTYHWQLTAHEPPCVVLIMGNLRHMNLHVWYLSWATHGTRTSMCGTYYGQLTAHEPPCVTLIMDNSRHMQLWVKCSDLLKWAPPGWKVFFCDMDEYIFANF